MLDLLRSRRAFPTRAFPDAAQAAGLDARDRAFARALLAGTIRRRGTLDALILPFSRRRNLDPAVHWTLRMALFQRFFLDGVPPYAAFGATLDAAKPVLRRGLQYANAVLRAIGRACVEEEVPGTAAADRLPAGDRSWRFDRPVFPDPRTDRTGYWAASLSYPQSLVERWVRQAGVEQALHRMRCFNATPPLNLRVNRLRAEVDDVRTQMVAAGLSPTPGRAPYSLVLHQHAGEVRRLPGFAEGLWAVQDIAAQQAVRLGEPGAGERILDLCAAPGGKAFAAWEIGGRKAEVWACDVSAGRLRKLREDQERLGHAVKVWHIEPGRAPAHPEGPWDLVILDVPCSNTGVLGRRPEARWKFSRAELNRCRVTQEGILRAAWPRLEPGRTRLLWTTCSLEPEENLTGLEEAAPRLGLEIREARTFEPTEDHSAGFAAVLVRRA